MMTLTKKSSFTAIAVSLVLGLSALSLPVSAAKPSDILNEIVGGQDIDRVEELSTAGGLVAVKAGHEFYIMSKNGRFVMDGTLRDTWQGGAVLSSMDDIDRYATRVNFDNLGIDFSELPTAILGSGNKKATLFVTDKCDTCTKAIEQAKDAGQDYQTQVVYVPQQLGNSYA